MEGRVGVVLARKLEGRVLVLQQRHLALAQRHVVRSLGFDRHVCVAVSRADGWCGEG